MYPTGAELASITETKAGSWFMRAAIRNLLSSSLQIVRNVTNFIFVNDQFLTTL